MAIDDKKAPVKITKASLIYGDQNWLRALVQAIPVVGGSIDTLIAATGQIYRQERVEFYVKYLEASIKGMEDRLQLLVGNNPEEFFDLFREHIEQADKTRSIEKKKRFSNILVNQIREQKPWNEAEMATRLLSNLTDLHILVLESIVAAPTCPAPFEGIKVTVVEPIEKTKDIPIDFHALTESFSSVEPYILKTVVIELLSSGFVKDEGVGRWGAVAMEKFSPLPLAEWFLTWIKK